MVLDGVMGGLSTGNIRQEEDTLVFSGDFRVDTAPVDGPPTDLARLQQLGDAGVTLLVSDSTGATGNRRTDLSRADRQKAHL